jgi:hypothetical protein
VIPISSLVSTGGAPNRNIFRRSSEIPTISGNGVKTGAPQLTVRTGRMTVSSSIGTSVIGAASIIALRLAVTRFFCPGEYSSCNTPLLSFVTKHGHPRLRARLVELAWRLVRSPITNRSSNGEQPWLKERSPQVLPANKPS